MTTISPLYRAFAYYSVGMGVYGATRGYRSNDSYNYHEKKWEKTQPLLGYRLMGTLFNGVMYACPPSGIIKLLNLINRIQIRQMGWKSEDFPKEYEEYIFGLHCRDTL